VKLVTSFLTLSVFCVCSAAVAIPVSTDQAVDRDELAALKDLHVSGVNDPQAAVGGDTVGTASNIPGIPYTDSGNTCAFVNDYDSVCPFGGSTAPDVVYQFTPGANVNVDISLCASAYDTKTYVFDAGLSVIACNDDTPGCGSDGFRSSLTAVPMTAGNTYYIVVDGYSTSCGDYELSVSENVPCIVDCPEGSVAEGEVDCFDGYVDNYNAGCNAVTPVFTAIPCDQFGGVTVCGTYGGYFDPASGFDYRDTDWYTVDPVANNGSVVWCVTGEYVTLTGYLSAVCPAVSFIDSATPNPCDTACFNLPAGALYLFVATSSFGADAGACGGNYTMTLDGYSCGPISVEPASWSTIKSMHR
jgi:hypothetical protein